MTINDEVTDDDSASHKASPDPDFLINMKLRQRMRQKKRDEVRRNQHIKAQERKELRKKIRQREEAKKARAAYLLEMSQKATAFYEGKWLLVHFGWAPWRKYLADVRLNNFLAEKHYQVKQ